MQTSGKTGSEIPFLQLVREGIEDFGSLLAWLVTVIVASLFGASLIVGLVSIGVRLSGKEPTDKTMWLVFSGAVLICLGLCIIATAHFEASYRVKKTHVPPTPPIDEEDDWDEGYGLMACIETIARWIIMGIVLLIVGWCTYLACNQFDVNGFWPRTGAIVGSIAVCWIPARMLAKRLVE